MKKILNKFKLFLSKKYVPQKNSVKPVELGYALSFTNSDIELDIFGSPKEIIDEVKKRGFDINEIAQLLNTAIDARVVQQDMPQLEFSGGPFAEHMMRLLDALASKDFESAKAIFNKAPGLLDVNNNCSSIPLISYADAGDLEVVKFLIDHKSSPNLPGQFGMTPLHWAAARGYDDVVDFLIAHGGNPISLGWFMLTPAEVAFLNENDTLADKLKNCAPEFYEPNMWMGFLQRMGIQDN